MRSSEGKRMNRDLTASCDHDIAARLSNLQIGR